MPFEISAHCSLICGLQFFVNIPSRLCIPTEHWYPPTWLRDVITQKTHTHNISVHCHVGVKLYEIGAYSTEDSSLWAYDAV